jgi:hypothetical protein
VRSASSQGVWQVWVQVLLRDTERVARRFPSRSQGRHGFFNSLKEMQEAYALYQNADTLQTNVEDELGGQHPKHGKRQRTKKHKHGKRKRAFNDDSSDDEEPRKKKGHHQKKPKKTRNDTKKDKGDTCPHCGKVHKKPWSDCWTLAQNKNKKPEWFKTDGKSQQQTSNAIQEGQQVLITADALQQLMNTVAAKSNPKGNLKDGADIDEDS